VRIGGSDPRNAVHIEVRLGPGLATAAGTRRLRVALPQGATVENLLERLRALEPGIAAGLDSALPVVGGNHTGRSQQLADGDEVALLIPVAGGAARDRQSERRAPWP
jgi:molybdopterin converting factor small subunit